MYNTHATKHLFQKTGFEKTLKILYKNPTIKTEKEFFDLFNKESYYNAYYRVKKQMIELNLIEVKDKTISLTVKGKRVYLQLKALIKEVKGKL